jgi:predicted NUDIX family phosphoesterase
MSKATSTMQLLEIPDGEPTGDQLENLAKRCRAALLKLKEPESEVRLPLIIEFSGSPKSGKSSIIGIIYHFLKRMGAEVIQPIEGASTRTPPGLRDDWLAFNAWSGCYALQQILVDCNDAPPPTMVILDRGLFDVAGWMQFLCDAERRISEDDREKITNFFQLDLWRQRENAVFLFLADHPTSLKREMHSKLTQETGSVMNNRTLDALRKSYEKVATQHQKQFGRLYVVDTSDRQGEPLSFQQVAYQVTLQMVQIIEELNTQMLLITAPVAFEGYLTEPRAIKKTISHILNDGKPNFLIRQEAEKSMEVQQIVPYALLKNADGKYFCARRRADSARAELRGKSTILVGGHAEQKDWNPTDPGSIFERCLRRELEEELVGISILKITPLAFINDTRTALGSHHLGYIHVIEIGGRTGIRRQAVEQEFGRESIVWKTAEQIKSSVDDLDPWSQLVAKEVFGAHLPKTAVQKEFFR